MRRALFAGVIAVIFILGVTVAIAGGGPPGGSPPGQDPCSHGATGKACRPDPGPGHGKDCEHHGNKGGVNEDHCAGTTTTPTTTVGTTTIGTTTATTPTTTTAATTTTSVTTSVGTTTAAATTTTASTTTATPAATTTAVVAGTTTTATPPSVVPPSVKPPKAIPAKQSVPKHPTTTKKAPPVRHAAVPHHKAPLVCKRGYRAWHGSCHAIIYGKG